MEINLTTGLFDEWLRRYGAAWEARDPAAAATLFTEDASYHWTPFDTPKSGRAQIAEAWRAATSRQQDVRFDHQILAIEGATGIARWHTVFTRSDSGKRVEVDGVLAAELDDATLCRVFREWWHTSESL